MLLFVSGEGFSQAFLARFWPSSLLPHMHCFCVCVCVCGCAVCNVYFQLVFKFEVYLLFIIDFGVFYMYGMENKDSNNNNWIYVASFH